MDRWSWCKNNNNEILVQQHGTRIYDGDDKTEFEDGCLQLTPTELIWRGHRHAISLPLECILQTEKMPGGIGRSPKIVLHVAKPHSNKYPGPVAYSKFDFIRLSFKNQGESQFHAMLSNALKAKAWINTSKTTSKQTATSGGRIKGAGIVGIERKREEQRKQTEQNISVAFHDLSNLMDKAKEMVNLSQVIATKIKDKQGDITEDETVKFKSYLLSLGIPNPVTKETHGSGTHYHMQLAREVCDALHPVLQKCGGIILLSDAYCRMNRARGMELLSPEDMINACKMFASMKLPLTLRTYESGVTVIQLQSHSEEKAVNQAVALVEDSTCLTAQQLSNLSDVSVLLAKERLLLGEQMGKLCRDDSVEGLIFYINLFALRSKA